MISFVEITLIGFGLSFDCFAVTVSFASCRKIIWKDLLRMALFFGFFQGMMTLAGWWLGDTLKQFIEPVDHWIAFGILAIIGVRMIIEALRHESKRRPVDLSSMKILLSLSVATSIDAFMTGVSMGFIVVRIFSATAIIGSLTFVVTLLGGKLGEKLRFIPARKAEIIGGMVLILIGVKILFQHLGIL
jgi:manganese efflux pump family protein